VARRGWEQRWAIGVAVLAALAVALTMTVRNTDLLPGERSVSRWMFEHAGGAGKDVSAILDVAMSKEVAPVMLAVLIKQRRTADGSNGSALCCPRRRQ